MIKKIYSKVDPSVLLHIIYKNDMGSEGIKEIKHHVITEQVHFLQVIGFEMPAGSIVKPHRHNIQERKTDQTHEALFVFRGSIELSIYDLDNSLVEKHVLKEGDCYVLINGGHNIKTLEPSRLFEFKNGPYNGSEKDKTEIN